MGAKALREAVTRALKFIDAQEAFQVLGQPTSTEHGSVRVDIKVRLDPLIAWKAQGRSPNGVFVEETVTFEFLFPYPLRAPRVYLREGFDCSLAHATPGAPGQRGTPCLVDGSLDEFHQREGMPGVLNQVKAWLEKAALGILNNPADGWEPTWRDSCPDVVLGDASLLRETVEAGGQGGSAWFSLDFMELGSRSGDLIPDQIHGKLGKDEWKLNKVSIKGRLQAYPYRDVGELRVRYGQSFGLLVWPKKGATASQYTHETVVDRAGLYERARGFGCEDFLRSSLGWLRQLLSPCPFQTPIPIVVILCARRPFHLVHSSSTLELCPYVLDLNPPHVFPRGDDTKVRPAGHRQTISRDLLQRMSGIGAQAHNPSWVQLGCGSLGSKIALHLARAGWPPAAVADSRSLSPHNAARHALIPTGDELIWEGLKAPALAKALETLGPTPVAHTEDVSQVVQRPELCAKLIPPGSWAALNATASLCVREALGALPTDGGHPCIIETSLYGGGELGVVTVEGPVHSPSTLDLQAHLYDLARSNPDLRARLFPQESATVRHPIGEGCGSETMVMSDARVSMYAAAMSEWLLGLRHSGLPSGEGILVVGTLGGDGISLSWAHHVVPPPQVFPPEVDGGWTVRLSAKAADLIEAEVGQYTTVETGGVLVGRLSEVSRTLFVTGVLPAPPDSKRSAAEFLLGIEGLEAAVEVFTKDSGETLHFLGTWHSHLKPSGPSGVDKATARRLAETRLSPSVMLIHTPTGYRVLLADSLQPS